MNNKPIILVTGANGQLGRCIQDLSKKTAWAGYRFHFTDIDTLDICHTGQLERVLDETGATIVINASGYTAVDKAEDEIELAYRINRDGPAVLAQVAAERDLYLIHISTDYVYSGQSCRPYCEEDETAPLSVYGKSKLAGEQAIQSSGCNASIIRTSWLYSEYGNNFVKTMLRLGQERERITVVSDQIGGPTYAGDLAVAIMAVLERNINRRGTNIYNFSNEGSISWYDFAQNIMELAGLRCHVGAIFTEEYPSKATRPAYSVFNLRKIKAETGIEIPYWRKSLSLVVNKLKK